MALPVVKTPTFRITLPSTKKEILIRPFTVKEEKMLLIAQQGEDEQQQISTIKQIIQNCIVEPEDYDVDSLASFDIEYVFVKLRAKSVGEIVNLKILPQQREGLPPMDVELNIDELEPIFPDDHTDLIEIADGMKVKMKYPTFGTVRKLHKMNNTEVLFNVFAECMDKIYDGDEVYDTKDSTEKETQDFLEQLQSKDLAKFKNFFDTMPRMEKTFDYEWTNPEDETDIHKESVVLRGILSFLS